jgi:hypothetical protein
MIEMDKIRELRKLLRPKFLKPTSRIKILTAEFCLISSKANGRMKYLYKLGDLMT